MKKLKVVTIVGTRPEIIRLSSTIKLLDKTCKHILVHTGQNYDFELNEIFFKDFGLSNPDYYLNAVGETSTSTIGKVLIETEKVLIKEKPDAVLVLGDTNSCISVLAAKRLKIPTFHYEAGNRCFDMRVPEEINRRIVDHTADINLTYSSIAREYLLAEGIKPDTVIKIGSPMKEVLDNHKTKIKNSTIHKKLSLKEKCYFLVSAHREENINSNKNFSSFVDTLNQLSKTYDLPVIVSTHPRTKKRIDDEKIKFHKNIQLLKPLNFSDYNSLQIKSRAVLSDSGTITEESSILNFPALNLREAHERPEGMEEASVMMVGMNYERIEQAIKMLESYKQKKVYVQDYEVDNVSNKVVKIILSYTDYINRVVWKKY